jgi:2-oxoglutarate dehydrogenase E2 component (dihydrolipoamide succinyltransferase)
MGESVVEGTVARWLKKVGDTVERMEPLLEISTDKIDTEVPAPASGTLLAILVEEGRTVNAGTVLAYLGQPDEVIEPAPALAPSPVQRGNTTGKSSAPTAEKAVVKEAEASKPVGRSFVSPVVARIAAEHNVDVTQVPGTGMGGRVTKKDILAFIEKRRSAAPVAPPEKIAPVPPEAAPQPLAADEVLQPLTAMRRAIAEHMVRSKQVSPHATTIFEVDMTAVVRHREASKRAFQEKGIHLTYTAYFVAAVASALRAVPEANSRFTDEGLVLYRRVHIGVATAIENGLLVPVIRDADEKNLQGLARAVNDVAERARRGQLSPDDLQGGTFTITNHGVTGSLFATPIINQPQAGILGVGAIVKRPVVISSDASLLPSADDAIVIRPMCYLSLSFDHRVLDGAKADAFVAAVKGALENWGS